MILPLRNSKHRPPYFRGEGACCCAPVACPLLVWFPAKYFLPCRPFSVVFSVVFSTEKRRGRIFFCQRRGTRHPLQAPSHDAQRVKFPGVSPDIASVPPGSRNTAPHPSVPTKLSESLKALA